MQVIPSIDLQNERSRIVYWPGAAAGQGTPTDRPDRISRTFVELGAPLIHVVDLDGARLGRPVNLGAIQAIAAAVATPLQVAGGIDGPEQIELAFAAGATRVVMPVGLVAEDPEILAACVRIAGDWLAIGLDARPERLAEFPWKGSRPDLDALLDRLSTAGVGRFVVSHAGAPEALATFVRLAAEHGAEVLAAGGVHDLEGVRRVRTAGVAGLILGEALLSGAIDYRAAAEVAAAGAA